LTVLTEGYVRAGRVSHSEGSLQLATKHYSSAIEGQQKHVLAAIGLAQMQMLNGNPPTHGIERLTNFCGFVVDEMAAAIHTLDTLLQPPNPQKSLEATVMLASLRAFPRPGVSSSDVVQERTKARELFDRINKAIEHEDALTNGHTQPRLPRTLFEDIEMHAEIARLWQGENLVRTGKAFHEALRISTANGEGQVDPRLLNNLGGLEHLGGNLAEARSFYESSLTNASSELAGGEKGDGMATSVLYNLARVYEESGEEWLANEAYDKLLTRHPEYVDGM
jgi:RNA polymerase-associated protein CTR9